jgi:copper chaperone CopZ
MTKIILKISGMHCSSCSMRIDGDLEEVEGVKLAQTNFARGFSEIEYEESKVSVDQLKQVISNAGYLVQA